jgi:hypothetical protein
MTTEQTKIKINLPHEMGTTATTIINNTHILFVRIEHDDSPSNPLDEDGTANGKIYSLGRNQVSYDPDAVRDAVKNNPDHVKLSYSEHGLCRWSVYGGFVLGQEFDFDRVDFAGVWVPDEGALSNIDFKGTDPEPAARRERILKYAEGVCEQYTQWCNGEVYGYIVSAYALQRDPGGDPIEERSYYRKHATAEADDSCWGFYGWDYALEETQRVAEGMAEELKDKPAEKQPPAPDPEIIEKLAAHYTEKMKGTVSANWDAGTRRYCIHGNHLPAAPSAQDLYPKGWTMIDYLTPAKANEVLGITELTAETEGPDFTFQNVTITIQAKDGAAAYTALCNALASIQAEYETDTYTIEGEDEERPVSELYPQVGE